MTLDRTEAPKTSGLHWKPVSACRVVTRGMYEKEMRSSHTSSLGIPNTCGGQQKAEAMLCGGRCTVQ